ncbi:methylated-DNA-[protein]-cysteine S-methyltransferase [Bacillus sp. OV322]|uniref:methylated-DNA--[protein]-cysteine S-methyltransferase n=1 Tax=Bacillus sp. OV322 TaxID=1882764 RepID=UPI0008EF9B34|nr:methylated-DNA--[protein]-cysteine S-methyltransferase [Bacillus sp. OV322]SFC02708.1 methylated-DNA-[protein]-cysteine S-methyltransferase [Bacillus sp. OV322]
MKYYYSQYERPEIGKLYLLADEEAMVHMTYNPADFEKQAAACHPVQMDEHQVFKELRIWLDGYFSGVNEEFTIPLREKGTEFQKQVWNRMKEIPYGETKSYSEIAYEINRPKAVRAIGQASKANPYPILVPCHRVVGKKGQLTGYAGSKTDIKDRLLTLENKNWVTR